MKVAILQEMNTKVLCVPVLRTPALDFSSGELPESKMKVNYLPVYDLELGNLRLKMAFDEETQILYVAEVAEERRL